MKTRLKFQFVILSILSIAPLAYAQNTAFTYHGRLIDGSTPVNGNYDVRFAVFAAESGGAAVTNFIPPTPISIANGLFTTRVDFGTNIFTGAPRWLEVSVKPAGSASYTNLTPRVELTSSPYSIRAREAAMLPDGALTASQLRVAGGNPSSGQVLGFDGSNLVWTSGTNVGGGPWSVLNGNAYFNGGNVGIGTNSPSSKLEVRGHLTLDSGGDAAIITGIGSLELNRYLSLFNSLNAPSASGLRAGGVLVADSYDYANPGKSDLIVKGNVGIGTPTPVSKLTVQSTPGGFFGGSVGLEHTDGLVRIATQTEPLLGFGAIGTLSHHHLVLFTDRFNGAGMTLGTDGNVSINGKVGIGAQDPNSQLYVRSENGFAVFGSSGFEGVHGESTHPTAAAVAGFNLSTGPGVYGESRGGGYGGYFLGRVRVGVLEIAGGVDLAEPFPMAEEAIDKGSVVVIDDEHPGRLTRSTHAYDTRVAGIISGANGINPGIALKQEGVLDQGQNVALTGRVYVQADANYGAIKPGDLLTTSDTPGHAMKVTDHAKAQGAILGKAMSGLPEGRGMVLVLVTLQ